MPYFVVDGTEINPDLIPKPSLCVACAKEETPDEMERLLCDLTRLNQQEEVDFRCFAFVPKHKTV